ncbi:hypothetical protein EAM01S_26_00300 [Erwinia amylovora NBRC 12687 = CFBP 1232]|nr:hypothetical protein EAM01S_26_00300 [Erwinia amylovora NBRC 12687 = CFBP 1232]
MLLVIIIIYICKGMPDNVQKTGQWLGRAGALCNDAIAGSDETVICRMAHANGNSVFGHGIHAVS